MHYRSATMGDPVKLTSQGCRRTLGLPSWLQMHFAALLLLLMVESTRSGGFDYHRINCGDKTHTIIRFPRAGRGPNCQDYIPDHLSQEEKDFIVDKHNEYRNEIALGYYPNPLLRSAADMKEMVWDDELEMIAQRLADQCLIYLDDCNDVARFPVDRNIFSREIYYEVSMEEEYTDAIYKLFYMNHPEGIQPARVVTWGFTYSLGCGRSRFRIRNVYNRNVVCLYGPKGDPGEGRLYTEGIPCSLCPGPCSNRYPGLCKVSS